MLVRFEYERLEMSMPTVQEAHSYLNLLNSPGWLEQIGDRNVKTEQEAIDYLESRVLKQFHTHGYGSYSIRLKMTRDWIGTVGLYHRDGLEAPDIGFALLEQYFGFGYAFEAATSILKHIHNLYPLSTISAITLPTNTASIKVINKLGMRYVKNVILPDSEDELMYHELQL